MGYPLIRLNNVSKRIESFSLDNICLELMPGQVHILMGENGSGKSLVMQIVSGYTQMDSGTIYYNGTELKQPLAKKTLLEKVVIIRQDTTMIRRLSLAENIYFKQLPYKNKLIKIIDHAKLNAMCRDLIDELKLPFDVYDSIDDLGLAQRQIASICRAYVSEADIVVLDEPSSSLSDTERHILYGIIDKLKARGTGIFYITHNISEVFTVGDTISIMRNGKLTTTKSLIDCREEDIIEMISGVYSTDRYPKLDVNIGKTIYQVSDLAHYGKLNNINLTLHKGEIIGVTGLAGSGRTLLANCLFGAAKVTSGTVRVNNEIIKVDCPATAIANGIALVPEDRLEESIFQYLDIFENIAFSSLHRFKNSFSIDSRFLEQVAISYIKKLNITNCDSSNILEYSGGSQQKAIIGKWIMNRAKIFILDEPTRGVDNACKIDIYNSIGDLAKKGAGIIIISSDIEEILGICDRVCVLSNHTFAANEPVSAMTKEKIIHLSMVD